MMLTFNVQVSEIWRMVSTYLGTQHQEPGCVHRTTKQMQISMENSISVGKWRVWQQMQLQDLKRAQHIDRMGPMKHDDGHRVGCWLNHMLAYLEEQIPG